jgi:hypothetical protein
VLSIPNVWKISFFKLIKFGRSSNNYQIFASLSKRPNLDLVEVAKKVSDVARSNPQSMGGHIQNANTPPTLYNRGRG